MRTHFSILLEARDMSEEDFRAYVRNMLLANAEGPEVDVRIRVSFHDLARPEVVEEERLNRMERAQWLIENIQKF